MKKDPFTDLYLKIKNFVKKFGVLYLIIKVTTTIVRPFNFKLFLKLKAYYFFKKSDVTIGSNVLINTPFFYGDFGKNVIIYSNTIFEFDINSRFTIGNNSVLSYGVLISCSKSKTGSMVVNGNIDGLKKGTVYLQKYKDTLLVSVDSVQLNGLSNFVLVDE